MKIMKCTLYNELIFYFYIEDEFLPIWYKNTIHEDT